MKMFKIISLENFDGYYGKVEIGDEIDCTFHEDIFECQKYVNNKYGKKGEDIKVRIEEVEV